MRLNLSIKDYILIGVIVVLSAIILFTHHNTSTERVLRQHTIDSLNSEIYKKDISIKHYDSTIKKLNSDVQSIQNKIKDNDAKIKVIHEKTEVKIKSVDSWDVDSLKRFFSERYGQDGNK